MKTNRNLFVAFSKIKIFDASQREWCGFLTPSEAVALIKFGAVARPFYSQKAVNNLRMGISNPQWFYFYMAPWIKMHYKTWYENTSSRNRSIK